LTTQRYPVRYIRFLYVNQMRSCIIVWRPFCWKGARVNRIHIHAQCVNWSVGISYPHSRACPLIGSFLLGFKYCDGTERESAEMSYSDVRSLVHFCRGFILWQQGTCFYVWLWYKRERTPKHSAIWLSDSLVFRCSFYYIFGIYGV
jgi:hypothetical protein